MGSERLKEAIGRLKKDERRQEISLAPSNTFEALLEKSVNRSRDASTACYSPSSAQWSFKLS